MGCNWSDTTIPPWENLRFKNFRNSKLNEYFIYVQKTFVSDLLELSKQIEKERHKLLKNLYMDELDLHYDHAYKPEIRDATLALFYAFNTHCDGNMITMLDMKFFDTMPYVDLNVYKLSDELRNYWKEFCLYVGSLCDRERDLELLDEQYPQIYEDALTICRSQYSNVTFDPYSPIVSSNQRVNFNIQQLRVCRDCIKFCFTQINRDLKGIKDAIMEIKRTPKTMRRVATVCKVDNLSKPWECYTKIARLRNLNIIPHKEIEYEKLNEELNKERLLKQKQKYKKFISEQKRLDNREDRDKEEMDLLYDKIGNNFRKMPSLAMSKQGGDIKSKRDMFKLKKLKIDDTLDSPMKQVKYDFADTESSRDISPKNRKPIIEGSPDKDFEDIGIMHQQVQRSPTNKQRGKQKKKLLKKPKQYDQPSNFNIFEPLNVGNNQYQPQLQFPIQLPVFLDRHIDYAPNSFKDPDLTIKAPTPMINFTNRTPHSPLASQGGINIDRPFAQTPIGLLKRRNSSDNKILMGPYGGSSNMKFESENEGLLFTHKPQQKQSDFVSFNF